MRDSRGLLILLAVVLVVATVVWLAIRPTPDRPRPKAEDDEPIRFHYTDPPVTSPGLEVNGVEVHGAIYPSYTSWAVTMSCAEADGCSGSIVVEIDYRNGTDVHQIMMASRADVPSGGELRFQGLQDSSTPVSEITMLSIKVNESRRSVDSMDEVED